MVKTMQGFAFIGFILTNLLGIALFPRTTVSAYLWYVLSNWGYKGDILVFFILLFATILSFAADIMQIIKNSN